MRVYPPGLENALEIGYNINQEPVAVGMYYDVPWFARLDSLTNHWVSLRPADRQEVAMYDIYWLKEMAITNGDLDDTRTEYHRS